MNDQYLQIATEKIPDNMILINIASRRARELSRGSSPLVKVAKGEGWLDIALNEIGNGKIVHDPDES